MGWHVYTAINATIRLSKLRCVLAIGYDMSEPYLPPEDVGGCSVEREAGREPGEFFVHVGKLFVAGERF